MTPSRRLFQPDSERHAVAVSLGLVARRGASRTAPQGPQGHRRGDLAGACLRALQDELEQRGLRVRPHAWISNEWFSPDTTPGIAIPFYLAHPRLMRLERKMIIDVEGGTVAGMHAHPAPRGRARDPARLSAAPPPRAGSSCSAARRPAIRLTTGPIPASKNYVQHLRLWYAQSHPDEDFAETFAVWLRPRSDWRKRYDGWPALKKLEYVDELMAEIAGERPTLTHRAPHRSAEQAERRRSPSITSRSRRSTRCRPPTHLRPRPAPHLLRRSAAPPRAGGLDLPPPPPRAASGAWCRNGPASIS